MIRGFKQVLVLAPHTDDGEIGCGGTVARLVEEGSDVYYIALSAAEESVPEGFPKDALRTEVAAATAVLGVEPSRLMVEHFKVRKFPEQRQDILERLVKLNKELEPDLVLMPSATDIHQDHQVVANEGLRAFKRTTLLGYEMPWNNVVFSTEMFVALDDRHVETKIRALECYKTQAGRAYLDAEFIRSLARTRGTQIQLPWAESFEVVRWILR
jgi:N-acetylglucosamine malate deacetylase 1